MDVVQPAGTRKLPGADLVPRHVDLSVVPDRFVRAVSEHPRVWNRRCLDIRKSSLPERGLVVGKTSGYDGPVMVKTDFNGGGGPERVLFRGLKWTWDVRELGLNSRASRGAESKTYPVYRDTKSVPDEG